MRQRGLSQRHRTLLFIVDGKRPLDEVIELGARAGVPRAYIDELIALGLVVLGAPVQPPVEAAWESPPSSGAASADGEPARDEWAEAADTAYLGLAMTNSEMDALDETEAGVGQARALLLALVRQHAPVAGTVTLLRLRRARGRAALAAVLPEVRARLARHVVVPEVATALHEAERLLGG